MTGLPSAAMVSARWSSANNSRTFGRAGSSACSGVCDATQARTKTEASFIVVSLSRTCAACQFEHRIELAFGDRLDREPRAAAQ